MTKEEYYRRKNEEVHVPYTNIQPPEYLTGTKQIEKFNYIAGMLTGIGVFTELDVDCLARYIISEQLYLQYTNLLAKMSKEKDPDIAELGKTQILQDKAFKQCRACARDLGLSVTARARLVVPSSDLEEDDEL